MEKLNDIFDKAQEIYGVDNLVKYGEQANRKALRLGIYFALNSTNFKKTEIADYLGIKDNSVNYNYLHFKANKSNYLEDIAKMEKSFKLMREL